MSSTWSTILDIQQLPQRALATMVHRSRHIQDLAINSAFARGHATEAISRTTACAISTILLRRAKLVNIAILEAPVSLALRGQAIPTTSRRVVLPLVDAHRGAVKATCRSGRQIAWAIATGRMRMTLDVPHVRPAQATLSTPARVSMDVQFRLLSITNVLLSLVIFQQLI